MFAFVDRNNKRLLAWRFMSARRFPDIYGVSARVCPDVFCRCYKMDIRFTGPFTLSPYRIGIDLKRRETSSRPSEDGEYKRFYRQLVKEISVEDWGILLGRFKAWKYQYTREYVYDRKKPPPFDEEGLAKGGLQDYYSLFPWAKPIRFVLEGVDYRVFDQYCLNHPNCGQSAIQFIGHRDNVQIARGGEIPFIEYNTMTEKIKRMPGTGSQPHAINMLIEGLCKEHPGVFDLFRERQKNLREMYEKFTGGKKPALKLNEPVKTEVPSLGSKPGRNAPCHCGSGKKYKKCCGAVT